jgi:hypothetical protein
LPESRSPFKKSKQAENKIKMMMGVII